jgi:TetR/AcrR family transcriptional regulator
MPATRRATKKEVVTAFRTREILAAARRAMDRQGLEGLTMEDIAATAGVAKGTLYLYFRGKEDLIQAVMTQAAENFLLDLEAAIATADPPRHKLCEVVALMVDFLRQERFFFPIFVRDMLHGIRPVKQDRWREIRTLEEKFMTILTRLFAEGVEKGEFIEANPRLLAFLFRGLLRATGYYLVVTGPEEVAQETLPIVFKVLFSGLSRRTQAYSASEVATQ